MEVKGINKCGPFDWHKPEPIVAPKNKKIKQNIKTLPINKYCNKHNSSSKSIEKKKKKGNGEEF